MPLMPGKKNIGNNIAMEENSGKSKKQALAIALSVARKPKKKMAHGGRAETPMDAFHDTDEPSDQGVNVREGKASTNHYGEKAEFRAAAKEDAKMRRSAEKKVVPKLKGLAQGGMIKTTPIKHPRMVNSDAISARLLAEQDEEQHPAGLESDNDEMSPSKEEIMSNHPAMLADGGDYDEYGYPKDKSKLKPLYNAKGGMIDAEENTAGNPVSRPDKGWGAVIVKADGGMIEDEEMDEHHASIAAAIMAKRDKALRMAEGGQVDIDSNNEEEPNQFYQQNEHAALKENYDSGMDGISQPQDSNEHADSREADEENEHDMISKIRSKMSMKRMFR